MKKNILIAILSVSLIASIGMQAVATSPALKDNLSSKGKFIFSGEDGIAGSDDDIVFDSEDFEILADNIDSNTENITNLDTDISNISVYVGDDKKIHFIDRTGADSVLNFSGGGGIYYLGTYNTDAKVDIKSKLPDEYASLSASNFIAEPISTSTNYSGCTGVEDNNYQATASMSCSKSYSDGTFSASFIAYGGAGCNNYGGAGGYMGRASTSAQAQYKLYVCIGEIQNI